MKTSEAAIGAGTLDEGSLGDYMSGFLGYGNPKAPVWLIGMEEGAGRGFDEIRRRIETWAVDSKPFQDVRDYHYAIELSEAFDENARVQRTWAPLIRMLLTAKGVTATNDTILDIQKSRWARKTGSVCLSELLPLPKRNREDWCYDRWSGRADLINRKTYERAWKPRRRAILSDSIASFGPQLIVFYGTGFRKDWTELAGGEMRPVADLKIWRRDHQGQSYLLVIHPSPLAPKPKDYFVGVGDYLRDQYDEALFVGFGV